MKRWMAVALCMLMAHIAAANAGDVRKTAEATMLVTGSIEVMPDGTVHDYSIDRPEKIPPLVVDLIKSNVPNWKFRRDDHVEAIFKAKMSLRIVAKHVDEQHDSVAISSANFGDAGAVHTDQVSPKKAPTPHYPLDAIRERVGGTVFLSMRVGRTGQVEDIAVEQVNLSVYGNEAQMRHCRRLLGDAALDALKTWTFNPPTTGKHVNDPYWDVRMPIAFDINVVGKSEDAYGKWHAYIPGPRESIPWAKDNQVSSSSDAIPENSVSQADQPLQLMTALDGA
jgi:TonB family protein